MTSRLKKFREYLKETAINCQKLVVQKPKQEAVIFKYVAKQDIKKPANDLIPATQELIYERACILVGDINLPFKWAEAVVKLQASAKPKNIPQSSWLEINAACSQLYTDDFALLKLIINNGWSLEDIYGCNKFTPLVRVDCMGVLLLLLQGDEVVGVNQEHIKILRRSGKVNYLHRRLDRQTKIDLLYEL